MSKIKAPIIGSITNCNDEPATQGGCIEAALRRQADLEANKIRVEVSNNKVTLRGRCAP